MKIAPLRSASTILKPRQLLASRPVIASAPAAAVGWSSAISGSSPRLRLPRAGPRVPGRFSTVATTPDRFIPIQVPPAMRSRPATVPGCSGHQASGGSQGRSSRSSRLAASRTKSGRTRTTTVHTCPNMACAEGKGQPPVVRHFVDSFKNGAPPEDPGYAGGPVKWAGAIGESPVLHPRGDNVSAARLSQGLGHGIDLRDRGGDHLRHLRH